MDTRSTRLHEIGTAIARELVEQGLTQYELSRMIGNSNHSYLSRIESGKKTPSLDLIFNIADVLEKDVNYFFSEI